MFDFLHVTGWIIGHLSSPQGYEGSLIKLTSKQVRFFTSVGVAVLTINRQFLTFKCLRYIYTMNCCFDD